MILANQRMLLLSAAMVLIGAIGGCQSPRYRTACATPEQANYAAPVAPAAPEVNRRVQEPPYLRGQTVPVPQVNPDDQWNRPVLPPPAPAERSQARGLPGGPALGDDSDDPSDEADDSDVDEPIFPKSGRRPPIIPSQPGASIHSPGRATLSSSTRVVEQTAVPERVPRYALPVTRCEPSTTAAPRAAAIDAESPSLPHSRPIPLANPPALLAPPADRP